MFQIRLKELREAAGYSQYSFAREFGVAQSTVGGWEAGKREPNFETIQRIADFFGVSVDYLLGRADEKKEPALTKKDERDIEILAAAKIQLENQEGLMFDGDPASPEAIESILSAMELGLQAAKMRNKEKYTPKKYKK